MSPLDPPARPPDPLTLPAISVILLTELDEFLRSGHIIGDDLAGFLARHGHIHPRFAAYNVIDDLCVTAAHPRRLTAGIDRDAAEHAHLADYFGEEHQQDR